MNRTPPIDIANIAMRRLETALTAYVVESCRQYTGSMLTFYERRMEYEDAIEDVQNVRSLISDWEHAPC